MLRDDPDQERALTGRWAIVTGAGRGIGRAIAQTLAREGAALLLVSRTRAQLEETERLCRDAGAADVRVELVDLTDAAATEALADRALVTAGDALDVLVNDAGVAEPGHATEGDPAAWQRMFAVNVFAPMILTRRLAPAMVRRERGIIINVGSVAALEGARVQGAYAASKHALRGWSLSCYERLRPFGIKVALLNPGFVRTEMTAEIPDALADRFIDPADVAAAARLVLTTGPTCCPQEITLRLVRPAYEPGRR